MRRIVAVFLCAALLCPLAGCWDHLEINKMLIVAGIGLDIGGSGARRYHATVEIVNVAAEGGQNITAELVEGWGSTLHGAVQDAMKMTGGVLFGNHCKILVLGDALAREGVSGVVETMLRSPQYRKTALLVVAKDATAATIMKSKTVNNDIISYELASIVKSNAESLRNTMPTGVYELHEALVSPCPYSVAPAVMLRANNGDGVLEADGCAVLSGGALKGYLDGGETELLGLLLRGAHGVTVTVDAPGGGETLDLRLSGGRASLHPTTAGGTLSLRVGLTAEGSLREAAAGGLDLSDPETVTAIERAAGRRLDELLRKLIRRVQLEFGADVFEFHRAFQEVYRQEWDSVAKEWETRFRALPVTVSCAVKLTGSGLIGSFTPHGSGGNALP